jgi:signal transduction histidine kinase
MPTTSSDRFARYSGAVGLTVVAAFAALFMQRLLGVPDGLVFAASVALAARFFGTGPGLLASGLSIVAIDFTMLPPVGCVEFTHPEELAYLSVFLVLSLVISGATHSLSHARSHAEGLASRTTRLLDVTTALAEAELPRDVGRVVMTQGLPVVEACVGLIGMVHDGEFRVLDWRPSPAVSDHAVPRIELHGDGPVATAMRTRRAVWLESRDELRRRFPEAFKRLRADTADAFMALPLVHGDAVIGGMMLGFASRTAFGATDHTFSHLLAQSVASALARASLFERERDGRHVAESLARVREEVLGVVAHDLRNPLGVAGSVLQMLAELDLPAAQRTNLLATGSRAITQMNRLIGDLLDVMRMEAGRLVLELEDVTAASALAYAEEGARHLAADKRITLSIEETDPSLHLRADRGRLAQVLGNLVSNAIKFTPAGGRVTLRARGDASEVVFEVADTGPGVSPENQSHLFDRFWQARGSDRRGVGLGLAIVRGIVDAHGGRVWVLSTVGHGSRFFVALPAHPAMESARAS